MQMTGKLPSVAFLLSGIFVAALGLNSFLLPNHFVDGGVTGVSNPSAFIVISPVHDTRGGVSKRLHLG